MLAAFNSLRVLLGLDADVSLPAGYNRGATDAASRKTRVNAHQVVTSLGDGSTPEPKEILVAEITIPGGGTIDLDLTDAPIIGAVDGSGNPTDGETVVGDRPFLIDFDTVFGSGDENAAAINVAPGASNGYAIFGAANDIDIKPQMKVMIYCANAGLPAAAAGAKLITFTGTSGDVIRVKIVLQD